jgi:hypothetical protein
MKAFLFFAFFLVAISGTALAEDQKSNSAPFGLSWGMSAAQVKSLGVELSDFPKSDWGTSLSATKLPKVIADAETVVLSFGFDDKLWRVAAVSRSFQNDPAGTATVTRYDELNKILADKYGKGRAVHQVDENAEQNFFLMHIKDGRSSWYTNYDTKDLTIQLAIGAADFSTGFWRLIFEQKALQAEFQKARSNGEKGAL